MADLQPPPDAGATLGRLLALCEPARRDLYFFVAEQGGWVSRDEAAAGLGLATTETRATMRTPAQWAALVFGVVYVVVGLAGWFVTEDFTGVDDGADLLGFHLNGAHNVVHLALGVVWIAASTRLDWARMINALFGAVLIIVGLTGMTGVLDELLNIEDAAEPDNYLHLATGAIALYFGTAGARGRA